MESPILSATTRIVFVIQLALSLYLLLRGHNLPGGGFIGGLVAAVAFTIYHVGIAKKVSLFGIRINPVSLIFTGLSLALVAGLWGVLVHGTFLQAVWGPEVSLPLLGKVKTGSVLVFDTGIYLLVAGMLTELTYSLGEETQWNS